MRPICNMSKLLHGIVIEENVPLRPSPFIPEDIEDLLERNWETDGGSRIEKHTIGLARISVLVNCDLDFNFIQPRECCPLEYLPSQPLTTPGVLFLFLWIQRVLMTGIQVLMMQDRRNSTCRHWPFSMSFLWWSMNGTKEMSERWAN